MLDADVAAFRAATGAKDVLAINRLAIYLKGQGLWDYARFYPMKSSQNAGSGSTAYGLGGLTTNNMTLVNSPTWGSDGVTFTAASSQYGNFGDIFNGGSATLFARIAFASASPTASNGVAGVYSSTTNERSFIMLRYGQFAGDPFGVVVSGNGINVDDLRTTGQQATAGDECVVFTVAASSDCKVFQNKTERTLTRAGGVAQLSTPFNTSLDVYFAAWNNGTSAVEHSDLRAICPLFVMSTLTTTQRETITDLVNAL